MAVSRPAGLIALMRKIDGIGTPSFRTNMAQACGAAALKQLLDGFRGERDPYGAPWRPLGRPHWSDVRAQKRSKGKPFRKHKVLQDTGRLRNSFSFRPVPEGFYIGTSVRYAAFHQNGTKALPQRMMLPDIHRGLGLWAKPVNAEANAFMRSYMGHS